MALLHHLPVLSSEQAVTLEEGQEIVGTECYCSSGHVLKKAASREQRDKLCKQWWRGKETRRETGEQWRSGCDTPAGLISLGGNPKDCCTGIRAWLSESHWQKQGPVPTVTFPMLLLMLYIYTFFCGTISPLNCTLNVYVSLSLWTCIGCFFELDPSFIQPFQPADISINLLVGNGPCCCVLLAEKISLNGEGSLYLNMGFVKMTYWHWYRMVFFFTCHFFIFWK